MGYHVITSYRLKCHPWTCISFCFACQISVCISGTGSWPLWFYSTPLQYPPYLQLQRPIWYHFCCCSLTLNCCSSCRKQKRWRRILPVWFYRRISCGLCWLRRRWKFSLFLRWGHQVGVWMGFLELQTLFDHLIQGLTSRRLLWYFWKDLLTLETLYLWIRSPRYVKYHAWVQSKSVWCSWLEEGRRPWFLQGSSWARGPITASDLRGIAIDSHSSQLFCITFLGLCPYPAVTPYTVPLLSVKPATSRPAASGQLPIQIIHFSDIHVDSVLRNRSKSQLHKPHLLPILYESRFTRK